MRMHELKLNKDPVSVTGISPGEYFAMDMLGNAIVLKCRAWVHGALFCDSEETTYYNPHKCFVVLKDPAINIDKVIHQCKIDRDKAAGINNTSTYIDKKCTELQNKYSKKK